MTDTNATEPKTLEQWIIENNANREEMAKELKIDIGTFHRIVSSNKCKSPERRDAVYAYTNGQVRLDPVGSGKKPKPKSKRGAPAWLSRMVEPGPYIFGCDGFDISFRRILGISNIGGNTFIEIEKNDGRISSINVRAIMTVKGYTDGHEQNLKAAA